MTKNQQIWLAIVAIVALYLFSKRRNTVTLANVSDPKNQLPLSTSALPADTFATIIAMQSPNISLGY